MLGAPVNHPLGQPRVRFGGITHIRQFRGIIGHLIIIETNPEPAAGPKQYRGSDKLLIGRKKSRIEIISPFVLLSITEESYINPIETHRRWTGTHGQLPCVCRYIYGRPSDISPQSLGRRRRRRQRVKNAWTER